MTNGERVMNERTAKALAAFKERAKEFGADAKRYLAEALTDWLESLKDNPEAHVYTLILGGVIVKVVGWIL